MTKHLNEEAKAIVGRAEQKACEFNHDFVGTEHVLLALVDHSREIATLLRRLGVEPDSLRQEIVKLVRRGIERTANKPLPLTPRANQAIQFAIEEATYVGQKQADAGHLLLGLLREPEGVAGLALRKLGLRFQDARDEVLKIRVMLMKIVERAIRPVRASTVAKRRMREELLAHLEGIYAQELERLNDPLAAIAEAGRRLGDPTELSRELEGALPRMEKIGYFLDRWFGWRAPETASRWMLRLSVRTFVISLIALLPLCVLSIARLGTGFAWPMIRTMCAFQTLVPLDVFLLGTLYFKTRDRLFGVFGARKSVFNAVATAWLFGFIAVWSLVAFETVAYWTPGVFVQMVPLYLLRSALGVVVLLVAVKISGPSEISDTIWCCLQLENPTSQQ